MFAGLLSKDVAVSAWGDPDKILAALAPFSLEKPRAIWSTGQQMLLQVAARNDAVTAKIFQHPESGVAVVFWGRLDNRPDLIVQLNAAHQSSDDELIALAWLKWGELCPEWLIGDFAFAVASPKTGVVFLARDVMGVKPLFYRADQHGVFFASTAAAFKPLQLGSLSRSQEWMARYLIDMSWSLTDTAYKEISKLNGAHSLLIYHDGRMNLRRYHQFNDDAPSEKKRDPKYLEAYRSAWEQAVAARIPEHGPFCVENSGGVDSGSIAAEVARQLFRDTDRMHCMAFCYEELEPEYIMATAMKYGLKNNLLFSHNPDRVLYGLICDKELEAVRRRDYKVAGYPSEHDNGPAHYPFYEYAKERSIPTLFSGFGGDEAVSHAGGMLQRFELLDQNNWPGLWDILPGSLPMKLLRLGKTVYQSMHMPDHSPGLKAAWESRWPYQILNEGILAKYDLKKKYFASAMAHEHLRRMNESAILELSNPYPATRLENCTLMAASYGIEYVWPMLDQRLIQQWLSTPSIWKTGRQGINRYLHRCAINNVSADIVAWKTTKDMGFAKVRAMKDAVDNQPILLNLLKLQETLPPELDEIIDGDKIKRMVKEGIERKWMGMEINMTMTENYLRLKKLSEWLTG